MVETKAENETTLRDRLALDRTQLANERTALAYIRTALMLAATGVTLPKLYPASLAVMCTGVVFICLAFAVMFVGFARFRRLSAELRKHFLNG